MSDIVIFNTFQSCVIYDYNFFLICQCSVSCGHGVSVRNVQCRSIDGQILRGGICDPSSRPYDTRKCYMGPCPLRPPQRSIVAKMTNITTTTTPTTTPTTTTDRATTTTTTRQPVKWRASDWSQVGLRKVELCVPE